MRQQSLFKEGPNLKIEGPFPKYYKTLRPGQYVKIVAKLEGNPDYKNTYIGFICVNVIGAQPHGPYMWHGDGGIAHDRLYEDEFLTEELTIRKPS